MNSSITNAEGPPQGQARRGLTLKMLSFRNVSALYLLAMICIIFAFWIPAKFFTWQDCKTIMENQAVTGITAIGLVIPMAAGAFDLAVGTEVGLAVVLMAWLLFAAGLPLMLAILLTLLAGGLVGLTSGLLITKVKIDSFIATLAMSSVLTAIVIWMSSDEQIIGINSGFSRIAATQIFGITLPVFILLVVSLLVWYGLEITPVGRRIYATGGNLEAARLAGVAVNSVIVLALVSCGVIVALGGIIEASSLNGGDPSIGPSYLLPAFTAAFLGSTQFKNGRFNVWGTIVAVFVLQAGVQGIELASAPIWIPNLFDGLALAAAVGLARFETRGTSGSAIRRAIRMRSSTESSESGETV